MVHAGVEGALMGLLKGSSSTPGNEVENPPPLFSRFSNE
jgi:hypothetical protein